MEHVNGRKFTEKKGEEEKIKAVLGMLARGTEAPMAEEAASACDCKTKH